MAKPRISNSVEVYLKMPMLGPVFRFLEYPSSFELTCRAFRDASRQSPWTLLLEYGQLRTDYLVQYPNCEGLRLNQVWWGDDMHVPSRLRSVEILCGHSLPEYNTASLQSISIVGGYKSVVFLWHEVPFGLNRLIYENQDGFDKTDLGGLRELSFAGSRGVHLPGIIAPHLLKIDVSRCDLQAFNVGQFPFLEELKCQKTSIVSIDNMHGNLRVIDAKDCFKLRTRPFIEAVKRDATGLTKLTMTYFGKFDEGRDLAHKEMKHIDFELYEGR